jgi:hypothetical protein
MVLSSNIIVSGFVFHIVRSVWDVYGLLEATIFSCFCTTKKKLLGSDYTERERLFLGMTAELTTCISSQG